MKSNIAKILFSTALFFTFHICFASEPSNQEQNMEATQNQLAMTQRIDITESIFQHEVRTVTMKEDVLTLANSVWVQYWPILLLSITLGFVGLKMMLDHQNRFKKPVNLWS